MYDIIPDQKNQALSVKNLIVFIQGMFGKINVINGHYIGARWRLRNLYGHEHPAYLQHVFADLILKIPADIFQSGHDIIKGFHIIEQIILIGLDYLFHMFFYGIKSYGPVPSHRGQLDGNLKTMGMGRALPSADHHKVICVKIKFIPILIYHLLPFLRVFEVPDLPGGPP